MHTRTKVWTLAALGALMLVAGPVAQGGRTGHEADDIEGARDHPVLARFAGARINAYSRQDYDEARMPDRAIEDDDKMQVLALEGRVTRIGYFIDGVKSALEVYRNYEAALKEGGFETLFTCKNDAQCGEAFQRYVLNSGKVRIVGEGDATIGGNYYAVLAKKAAPGGDVYVFLDIMHDDVNQITPVFQQVVEVLPMARGQVRAP